MNNYGFLVGPYFLGFAITAVVLVLIAVWSGRATWIRMTAVALFLPMAYLSYAVVDDLLSRPKPVTYAELQSQIPEGHPGHLVLYGEANEGGVYLLLRSPGQTEPRYFFMLPRDPTQGKKMKEGFEKAQREAKQKGTQLLLGGKHKNRGKKGEGKKKGEGEENEDMETIFHPAPVSGGPPKNSADERPAYIPTPGAEDMGPY